ncbi:MAG: hypothetical protein P8R31_01190 [Mariniblastus sp.]|nr:hypothetical protein [Mariniblastus sp.]
MAIQFPCTHCNTILRIDEAHIGKQARCPQCQTLNLVTENMQFSESDSEQNQPPPAGPNPYSPGLPTTPSNSVRSQQPHRGGLILGLGIASILCNVCLIPGVLAWILGKQDMRKINQGIMDPEGRSMTQAGMVIGMVITILFFLSVAAWFLLSIALVFVQGI